MINEIDEFLNDEIKETKKQEIIIDIEIKERLWKLNETEYNNLKESILNDGCRESLILWNNILIDGHNRYEICKAFDVEYKTVQKQFKSKNDVMKWIDTNQLSRRNLLDWQRDIILGRLSKANKLNIGENQFTNRVMQNAPASTTNQMQLAKDLNVNKSTLQRAEKFVDAYDDIERNIGKEKAVEIVSKLTKQEVVEIGKMNSFEQDEVYEKMNSDTKYKSGTSIVKEIKKEKHFEERKNNLPLNIKIYNDNCLNILKEIEDNSIDCILTDPPYAIDFVSSWKPENKVEFEDSKEEIIPLLNEVCKLLTVKCKKDAHLYFFSSWMSYSSFEQIISKYFDISNVIIWEKNNTSLVDFDKRYGFSYEQIIFCKQKGNNERMLKNKSSRDVIHFNRINNPDHTCEKPIDLLEYFIENSIVENELVVDLFAGTFNSMVASRNLKRSYIGVEIKNEFFKKGEMK